MTRALQTHWMSENGIPCRLNGPFAKSTQDTEQVTCQFCLVFIQKDKIGSSIIDKPIEIDGKRYSSIANASKVLKLTRYRIKKNLDSLEFPNWRYVEKEKVT